MEVVFADIWKMVAEKDEMEWVHEQGRSGLAASVGIEVPCQVEMEAYSTPSCGSGKGGQF